MKTAELQQLNSEQLVRRGRELREELFKLILRKQTAQLEKPSRIKELRRNIARVETLRRQREIQGAEAKK